MRAKKMDISIRLAKDTDIETSAEILAISFLNDPARAWLVDDQEDRLVVLQDYFRAWMALGLRSGTVHLAEVRGMGTIGVSIWCPNGAEDEAFRKEVKKLAGVHAPRFFQYEDITSAFYPPADMYYKLSLIAVHPAAQGKGAGSALVAYQLDEMDRTGMPTYLVASTRVSAGGIYERAGYQPVGEPIRLPGGEEIYPMWRNPHEISSAPPMKEVASATSNSDLIRFGDLDWCILEVQNDRALVLCDKVIEKRRYHERHEAITWARCTLRYYLNDNLFKTFSSDEQSLIIETRKINPSNYWFGTDGGEDTFDRIFLLSFPEVVKYFGDSRQLRHKNKNTKYFIDDAFNVERTAVDVQQKPSSWWLRSPGNSSSFASCVTADGRIAVGGDFVNRFNAPDSGVRPAMWVNWQRFRQMG